MAGSVGYFEDIDSGEYQYYWLTGEQYIMWRNICYGKDPGDADAEIKWLIEIEWLMKITEQNEDLYFIDATTVECFFGNPLTAMSLKDSYDFEADFEAY